MQEALYYIQDYKHEKNLVQCVLCPRKCVIQDGTIGYCNVRQNVNGKLFSLVYGKAAALQVDPIEKKPLFHFLPGTKVFSLGTVGCNLRCKFCQNFHTSQTKPGEYREIEIPPREIVELAAEHGCNSIATTYNDPIIFYEYVLDIFKEARNKGIKTVMVSNGFICEEPLREIMNYMDAINVDLKGFSNKFYGSVTSAWLSPILDTLKILHNSKVWFEVTNLIIPTLNDSDEEIMKMCRWILENIGDEHPLHFTGFHPDYQMKNLPSTSRETLLRAYKIAKDIGLKYVYVGNVMSGNAENTYCHKCNVLLIERHGYSIEKMNIVDGKCMFCKERIHGVFD